jgi:hypothetical protein
MDKLIAEIKAFCVANYENGYDSIVECFDYADMIEYIERNKITSLDDFVRSYAVIIDYKNEIKSTAF